MSINITKITKRSDRATGSNITYKDVYFDVTEDETPVSGTLYGKVTKTDIRHSVDEGAIMNSIKNIFNTIPGEKVLNPEFGLNLAQWLFEPVTEFRAKEIGEAIFNGVTKYEPRVNMKSVTVIADAENSQYQIKLAITIPQLNISKELPAILNAPGFDFLTDS